MISGRKIDESLPLSKGDFNADVSEHSVISFCTLFKGKKHCEETFMLQESRKSQLHRSFPNKYFYTKPISLIFIS